MSDKGTDNASLSLWPSMAFGNIGALSRHHA